MLDKTSKAILNTVRESAGELGLVALSEIFSPNDIIWLVQNHYLYRLSNDVIELATPGRIYLEHYWKNFVLRWLPLIISAASFVLAFFAFACK